MGITMAAQRAGGSDGGEARRRTGESSVEQGAKRSAEVHHALRREWLARLRGLRRRCDELLASGRLISGVHRHTSTVSKEGMHIEVEASFGARLLFEVEAFLAEEFGSRPEAVSLLGECAGTALTAAESQLAGRVELKVYPQWHPQMLEALREIHRRTMAGLPANPAATGSLPAYRWRLPTGVHIATWDELSRRCLAGDAHRRVPGVYCWDPAQVVAALQDHGLRRVLVLHQFLARHSCDTDVVLLGERRFDWMDLSGTYLTSDPFDWFIHFDDHGYWGAVGWPLQHAALPLL